jgi:hypothetical protein
MEILVSLKSMFITGFISGMPCSIIVSFFDRKAAIPLTLWTIFCGVALLIIK